LICQTSLATRRGADCDQDAPWRQVNELAIRSTDILRHFVLVHRETPDSNDPLRRYLLLMDSVSGVGYYLAEWYLPELTEEAVDDIVAKLDIAAVDISDEGTPVRLVVTLAVPTDEVLYGVFGAHSPDIVTITCQRAGIPHQRLSAHVGTRIREDPLAAMVGKACIRSSVEAEPTPQ
jgi:hypothetical protein